MKILITGNMGAGKSHLARQVVAMKPGLAYHAVDAFRREYGDGSMAQEAVARAAFLAAIQSPGPMLIECMGLGDLGQEVQAVLRHEPLTVILLTVPLAVCLARLGSRSWEVPYPGTPETALELCARSHALFGAGEIQSRFAKQATGGVYTFPHMDAGHTQAVAAFILNQFTHETT